jgi:hypothetical protein
VALSVEEDHVALSVTSIVDPSVYVPVAMNCCVNPLGTDCVGGFTAIATSAAGVPVSVADPEMPVAGSVAVTTAGPSVMEVARPTGIEGAVATLIDPLEDAQVTVFVSTCFDMSL